MEISSSSSNILQSIQGPPQSVEQPTAQRPASDVTETSGRTVSNSVQSPDQSGAQQQNAVSAAPASERPEAQDNDSRVGTRIDLRA
jgi:hypothetical protein